MKLFPDISQLFNGPAERGRAIRAGARGISIAVIQHVYNLIHDPRFLRPLLVIGLLLLSVALPRIISSRQLILIPVVVVGGGAALAFLRWPPIGIIAATVAGLVVPFYGPSGLNVTMILVALLSGFWLLEKIIHQREIHLVSSRTIWPLVAFVAAVLLSFGFGQLLWFTFTSTAPLGAQLGGMAIALLSTLAFLLVAHQVKDITWLSRLTWAFLVVAALSFTFKSVLPLFGLPTYHLFQQVGSLFYVWMVAIAFSQAVFNRDLHRGWRIALGILIIVCFYSLFFLKFGDKSGWLPVVIALVTIVVLRSWRTVFVLVPLGILAAVILAPEFVSTDEYSIATRFDAWLIMLEIIKYSPVLGLGFANYYSYTTLFPIRGYAVSFNSHNNYVDIVAQTGLVGLVCLLWFLWEVARLGWRLKNRAPAGFAQAYVYGALGGLTATAFAGLLGDWVLPFFYNVGLFGFRTSVLAWLFLGGLVALEQIDKRTNLINERSND